MFDTIYSYTREQALEDGVLIDISNLASEAGFIFPVAVTNTLHSIVTDIPEEFSCQDETGRLWDILMLAHYNSKNSERNTRQLNFKVNIPHYEGVKIENDLDVKVLIHPGDNMEPVLTMMLPNED